MIINSKTGTIVSGRLLSDAELTCFGEKKWPKARFAIIYADKQKGAILDCEALFDLASSCKNLKKNDRAIVAGIVEEYESREGAPRKRLRVDAIASATTPAPALQLGRRLQDDAEDFEEQTGFTDIEDDELPF